ncbi:polysaccharide export protein, partial [Klebsiella pneumoniae]
MSITKRINKMNSFKWILLAFPLALLSGCTIVPGSSISTISKDKQDVPDSDFNINDMVDVTTITPSLVNQMSADIIKTNSNPSTSFGNKSYAYKVGAGDILRITVYNHPELTNPQGQYRSAKEAGVLVKNDGTIIFPYVGELKVSGMSVEKIRSTLSERLVKYIEDPQVDVSVAEFASQKVYVSGSVNIPGKQPVTDVPLTVMDAIGAAGGITSDADWEHAVITHAGKNEIVSLRSLLQMGDLSQNKTLYPGDSLYVPRNDELKITVMGEVTTQTTLNTGLYGMTLAEAIANSEGISQSHADASGIFVIRPTGTNEGKIAKIYQLNMSDAAS